MTVGAGLSDATKGAQEVVSGLRGACAEIGGEAGRVHRAIDGARRHLHAAFAEHQAACRCDPCSLPRPRRWRQGLHEYWYRLQALCALPGQERTPNVTISKSLSLWWWTRYTRRSCG